MQYHQSNGVWMRCRATKRAGYGVTGCPIGSTVHAEGRLGIAQQGGGIEEIPDNGGRRVNSISPIYDGFFVVESSTGRRRWYDFLGKLVPLRLRAKERRKWVPGVGHRLNETA